MTFIFERSRQLYALSAQYPEKYCLAVQVYLE